MRTTSFLLAGIMCLSLSVRSQKFEDLAMTPPINEKVIRETADAMVAAGMQQAGYRYTRSILTNREAIAIDQDPLGH